MTHGEGGSKISQKSVTYYLNGLTVKKYELLFYELTVFPKKIAIIQNKSYEPHEVLNSV